MSDSANTLMDEIARLQDLLDATKRRNVRLHILLRECFLILAGIQGDGEDLARRIRSELD